jgi:hypothetical protein
LPAKDLGQLVLGHAVVLEDAGDARLDRRVRVVVGVGLRGEIVADEVLVVAGPDPLVDVEVAVAVGLEARRIGHRPERQVLAAEMRGRAPRRLLLLGVAVDPGHDVDAPAEIGHVGRVVRPARQPLPGARLGIVDVVRARQDREAADIADHRGIVGLGVRADVAPPGQHRAGAGEELLEAGGAGIGIELVGWLRGQRVDHVLDGADPGRVVDPRLHRVDVEQPRLVARVLGVGRRPAAEEVEAEAAPGLGRVEIAVGVLAGELLAP